MEKYNLKDMIKTYEKFNKYIHLNHGSKNLPKVDIVHRDNGQKWYEQWLLNGKYHREDGPAYQLWYRNGQKEKESWYLNNKRHREDGPAQQGWFGNGQKISEFWNLNGKYYNREEWVEELGEIGSPHYEEQRMLLDMEKYNL